MTVLHKYTALIESYNAFMKNQPFIGGGDADKNIVMLVILTFAAFISG